MITTQFLRDHAKFRGVAIGMKRASRAISLDGVQRLTPAQQRALEFARARAVAATPVARQRIEAVAGSTTSPISPSTCSNDLAAELVAGVLRRGRVALHFHPDRLLADGLTVVESLHRDGVYRSQFETRISNGGLTAMPGGDRDRWEKELFGGAFQKPGGLPSERPKYGALDLARHADGPAPRFGSCYLRLRPSALDRCTLLCGDTFLQRGDVGTMDAALPVLAGLLEAVAGDGWRLGHERLDVEALVRLLLAGPPIEPFNGRPGRALDEYVEVQVHGDVRLIEDVELLVADPSFRDDATGQRLRELAAGYGFALHWHQGFELEVDRIPADFRDPVMPELGLRLQRDFPAALGSAGSAASRLDAAMIGRGAASVNLEPDRWADLGCPAEVLQYLKQLWHVLVRYGRPAS